MNQIEILLIGLLVAVVGRSALARALAVPYPIVLVLGGAVLGFIPGLKRCRKAGPDPNKVTSYVSRPPEC
jgi:hypothetical protein